MLSAEIVLAYHRANLKYLSALKVMGEPEQTLIAGVSEAEFIANAVDADHASVEREYTFEQAEQSVTDRALVTLSRTLRRRKRHNRRAQIRARGAALQAIAAERLNRRKYTVRRPAPGKRREYAWAQVEKQVLKQPGGKFLEVTLNGPDGDRQLHWRLNVAVLRAAMRLDGKFILVSNDHTRTPSSRRGWAPAELVACYGEKDKVEKANRTLKGPLRLRPLFLHNDERIEALVFVTMLTLLTYSILELKCRRRGLRVTGEAILKGFAHLALVYTVCRDSSVLVRVTPLTAFQRQVVAALGASAWPFPVTPATGRGGHAPGLFGQSTVLRASGSPIVPGQLPVPYRLPLLA